MNVDWARAATLVSLGAVLLILLLLTGPGGAPGFLVDPPQS